MKTALPLLILIGRPAAGKSEVIRFLHGLPDARRTGECHIGPFREIDDFPMIWAWFEEDDILSRNGRLRLHTDDEGYFRDNFLWNLLIERIELDYWKLRKEQSQEGTTAILEFARGTEHGGFREAFAHLSDRLLSQAAVLYINVSYEESLRKNRRRFNPDKPHSILEHGLPDEKLDRLYRGNDWAEFSSADPAYLDVGKVRVPYAVLENEDDVTTGGGDPLGERLKETLSLLWDRWRSRPEADEGSGAGDPAGRTAASGEAIRPSDRNPDAPPDIRIVAADESHFAAHASEMLIERDEIESIIRRALTQAPRNGHVRTSVRHSRAIGYTGLKRVRLRDAASFWGRRPKRGILSHLVDAPRKKTRNLCFWGDWVDSNVFRLVTFYPGTPAPREIHDPAISASEMKEAVAFWATHAIVADSRAAQA